ncbi:hypothetical protein BDZ97DRAFT_511066 [Flammula alnicola]|nr:hypothetical protein BDZ97DRAFT_511066 [Flammula alnicola]
MISQKTGLRGAFFVEPPNLFEGMTDSPSHCAARLTGLRSTIQTNMWKICEIPINDNLIGTHVEYGAYSTSFLLPSSSPGALGGTPKAQSVNSGHSVVILDQDRNESWARTAREYYFSNGKCTRLLLRVLSSESRDAKDKIGLMKSTFVKEISATNSHDQLTYVQEFVECHAATVYGCRSREVEGLTVSLSEEYQNLPYLP